MKNRNFLIVSAILISGLVLVYSNHFKNNFHFDDSHSIVNNVYIRSLHNIPLFFKDATTISTLPANQSYRPLLSASYAVDYWLGGGLNTFYFHLSTFTWYVLQCVLMFIVLKKLLDKFNPLPANRWIALFSVAYYAFHTANAETINYISARSDSVSTFWLIVALWIFISFPRLRWAGFGIYILPLAASILFKPATLVFPGLLFLYVLFFESKFATPRFFSRQNFSALFRSFMLALPSLVICAALYFLHSKMTPSTFIPGLTSRADYLITQPFVSLHYFKNFFLPNDLSADTDWVPLTSALHWKFFAGVIFIFAMLIAAWFFARKKETQGISFGIIWFFMALLPSSSIIPFAEVMNDHRTFFPYVGLIISLGFLLQHFAIRKKTGNRVHSAVSAISMLIISVHAYGTVQRNKVWSTDESLWKDVTEKSPGNARGHMNYGIALMGKGKYDEAEKFFENTLSIWPYYDYGLINMGVLKNAKGKPNEAELYFKKAVQYGPMNPEAYYYYAEFLNGKNRPEEAVSLLKKAIEISPAHTYARLLLMNIYTNEYRWKELEKLSEETLRILPDDINAKYFLAISKTGKTKLEMALELAQRDPSAENYLNLSLISYQENDFAGCVHYAEKALTVKPDYAEAYNNIGSAYNQLGKYDSAEVALSRALAIDPDYSLAANNLAISKRRRQQEKIFADALKKNPSEGIYLELSFFYYKQNMFAKSVEAAEQALRLNPSSAEAFNNICSAYNNLKNWDKAIEACNMALKLKPDFQLAKNNLAFALEKKGS